MTQAKRTAVEVNGVSFTEEMIQQMKGGEPLSGSISGGVAIGQEATSFPPSQSIAIDGYQHQLRPRVAGNDPSTQGLVSKVDVERFNQQHAQRQLQELEAAEQLQREREELQAVTNPRKLHDTLQALGRKINKLEKQLAEAQKTIATLSV